jgi:hypothetical protein
VTRRCDQIVEERMRKEFFPNTAPRFLHALVIIIGVMGIIGFGADLLFNSPPPDQQTGDEMLFVAVIILTGAAVATWKKRNDPLPLQIAIDDSGLWLEEVGELMRWSEIQEVRTSYWGTEPSCTITWRHRSIRIHSADDHYRDGDGKMWVAPGVYGEIKSCWKRRAAAAAPAPRTA